MMVPKSTTDIRDKSEGRYVEKTNNASEDVSPRHNDDESMTIGNFNGVTLNNQVEQNISETIDPVDQEMYKQLKVKVNKHTVNYNDLILEAENTGHEDTGRHDDTIQ